MKNIFAEIIGPEVPEESKTLENCKQKIIASYGDRVASCQELSWLSCDSIIYLIAHGDDPQTKQNPRFGDKNPEDVATIIQKILKGFCNASSGKRFSGLIILEGCHSAEVGQYSQKQLSFKQQLEALLKNSRSFKSISEPEARIGGYLGQAFDPENYQKTIYGISSTDNKNTIRFQTKRGVYGYKQGDGSIKYDENTYIENRVMQDSPSPQLTRRNSHKASLANHQFRELS